jgi:hypothetical protein
MVLQDWIWFSGLDKDGVLTGLDLVSGFGLFLDQVMFFRIWFNGFMVLDLAI